VRKSYEINGDTLALIYINENKTKVIETNNEFTINNNINQIMDYSCRYFGSSFLGRIEGSKHLIGMNYKLPIIIEETQELIFFPTASTKTKGCIWLSLSNIDKHYREGKRSVIKFKNKKTLNINLTYGALQSQMSRATILLFKLKSRKKMS